MRSVLCVSLLTILFSTSEPGAGLKHVDVFRSGDHGYFGYRIPAIETAADGTLLAFVEARKYTLGDPGLEGQEIDLVLRRSTDGGATWSPMQLIEHAGDFWSAANPSTLVDRSDNRVWVFYLRCRPGRNTHTARPMTDDIRLLARSSSDSGATWTQPIELTATCRDMEDGSWRTSVPGPGGAIQDGKGRLLVPMWMFEPWRNFAIFSEDHGRTWQRGAFVPGGREGDECQLVELSDGTLLLDIRQQAGAHRWLSTSRDGGRTWSEPRAGETVTPVACAIERADRNRLVWTGPRGPGRNNLVLRSSSDDGRSFAGELLIFEGPAAYSDLTILKDGSIGILWERGVERTYQFVSFTRVESSGLRNLAAFQRKNH